MNDSTSSPFQNYESEDEFNRLAMLVLNSEATDEEKLEFEKIVNENKEAELKFRELKQTYHLLKKSIPVSNSSEMKEPAFPEYRMNQLRHAVKQSFPPHTETKESSSWISIFDWRSLLRPTFSYGVLILAIVAGIYFYFLHYSIEIEPLRTNGGFAVIENGKPQLIRHYSNVNFEKTQLLKEGDKIKVARGESVHVITPRGKTLLIGPKIYVVTKEEADHSPTLFDRLFNNETTELISNIPLILTRSGSSSIYSPRGYTTQSPLLVIWGSESDHNYDLQLSDELESNKTITIHNAQSPLNLSEYFTKNSMPMLSDGFYKITIFDTPKNIPIAETRFQLAGAQKPTTELSEIERIEIAKEALKSSPPRVGDALSILLTLTPQFQESDLALRLKLYAFGQAGLEKEFRATQNQISTKAN
jgi:hypothetical protein